VRTAIQRHGRLVIAAGIVLAVVAVSLGVILERGGGNASAASRYGRLPTWLPKAKAGTGRVLVATTARPKLAIEGDTVSIALRHGHVLATTVGPAVPEDGKFPVPPTSPCRFTVTFTAATGAVPLEAGSFTILDELGHAHHPHVSAAHGPARSHRHARRERRAADRWRPAALGPGEREADRVLGLRRGDRLTAVPDGARVRMNTRAVRSVNFRSLMPS
jgi:hypothetical protein